MGVADLVAREGRRLRRRPERQVRDGRDPRRPAGGGEARGATSSSRWSPRATKALMEEFFEKGTLAADDARAGLRSAVLAGRIFPVLPASSLRNVGGAPAARRLVDLLPVARRSRRGDGAATPRPGGDRRASPTAEAPALGVRVQDASSTRTPAGISLFRVYSGTLKSDSHGPQHHARRGRAAGLAAAAAGQDPDPGARDPGRRHRRGGEAQGDADRRHARGQGAPDRLPAGRVPGARHHLRDRAEDARRRRQDLDRAAPPAWRRTRCCASRATRRRTRCCSRASASSTSRWWSARLRKRYKVEVNLKKPKIPYRETIKGAAEGHGRHKKQTGGHGQFGDCKIRMKPLRARRRLQVRRRHLRRLASPGTSSPRSRRASRRRASRA